MRIEELNNYFYLDFELSNGIRWKIRNSRKLKIGCPAGGKNGNGYYMTQVNGVRILNHRIIYSIHNNYELSNNEIVDHIDRNIHNNNPNNLRLSNKILNGRNKIKVKNCYSEYKGVSYNKRKNKWTSSMKINGVAIWLGYHDSEVEAALAYNNYIQREKLECYILNDVK